MKGDNLNMLPDEEMVTKSSGNNGLGIGIITRGWSSIKWMMHMQQISKHMPVGMFWKNIIVEGRPWAEARNEVVNQARSSNFEWLMFIDDDVFIPMEAINKMLASKKKIISGVYWTKSDTPRPVMFKEMGSGPYDDFPLDKIIEIGGSGLGCTLVHMSVFDDFDNANIPYFLEDWVHTDKSGKNYKCPVGEDHYFFTKARELGHNVYCDTSILCDHYDYKNKRFSPNDDIVREISERQLNKAGRNDIVKKHNNALGLDKSKKTMVFYNASTTFFSGDSLEKGPLGGTETSIINMTKRFAKDFNVHVFSACDPGVYDNVVYHDIRSHTDKDIEVLNADVLFLLRNPNVLNTIDFKSIGVKKVVLWSHDMAKDPVWSGVNQNIDKIDEIFVLSEWHKKEVRKLYKIPEEKFYVTSNGVDKSLFGPREKVKGKCIYSSTPFRGLDILLEVWPKIKERVPEANLHVFSSMKVYGANHQDDVFEQLYQAARAMDGVTYYSSVKQDKLAEHMGESEVLVYPNTFDETSCITVMEAQTCETYVVSSNKGALPETVKKRTGVLIDGNPYSDEYKEIFVNEVVDELLNPRVTDFTYDFSWDKVSEKWKTHLFGDVDTNYVSTNFDNPEMCNTPEYWDYVYKNELEQDIVRHDKKLHGRIISEIDEGELVLDIGCGTGEFTRYLRLLAPAAEIWGTDISSEAIDFCREKDRTIFYANHPVSNTENFEENYFNVVVAQHVIEHFKDEKELIDKMKYLVKPEGKIILVIPINDDEYKEHYKIWQMSDVYNMVSEYFPKEAVKVEHRVLDNKFYQNGRPFEEAIIIINMRGEKNDI